MEKGDFGRYAPLLKVIWVSNLKTFVKKSDSKRGRFFIYYVLKITLSVASDTNVKAVFVGAGSAPHFGVGAIAQKSQSAGLLGLGKLYYNTAKINLQLLF